MMLKPSLVAIVLAAAATAAAAQDGPPLTLQDAITQARANAPAQRQAQTAAQLAAEDRTQARAGLLPTLNGLWQFIYTQPNGTNSGVFVANDGPRVYNVNANAHGDLFAPVKWADYRAAGAAEAVARAKADVAARGLVVTVVQAYYQLVASERKAGSAREGVTEARRFLEITQKQERGGEVAHSDVVKAQIQESQRERDAQDADLIALKSRLALSVLVFPDYRGNFTVTDDMQNVEPLPPIDGIKTAASNNSPDVRAAESAVQQENSSITSARSGYLPSISFDYTYGILANQFAVHDPAGNLLLGSSASVQMSVPMWNWGATQSKIRQAHLRAEQAKADLSLTQRTLLANIDTFYAEAQVAQSQVASLRSSLDLSVESLRLTTLRYQAGEATVLEVVDAQNTLLQARAAYEDGLVRYRVALAALQTLTGTL